MGVRSSKEGTAVSTPQGEVASKELIDECMAFLEDQLPKLFMEGGMDSSRFEEKVQFVDPITKYDSIGGYLFNISMLRVLFSPIFELQKVYQTGPSEVTTRWTMTMQFSLLPWRPRLVFTGLSIYRINPASGKFNTHIDLWDSVDDNSYFSIEGLRDLLGQAGQLYKSPDRPTPVYRVLERRAAFEVREYDPFNVAQAAAPEGTGLVPSDSPALAAASKYIQGGNRGGERLEECTPLLLAVGRDPSQLQLQLVLPPARSLESLPSPAGDEVAIAQLPGGTVAAVKFSGRPDSVEILSRESALRRALVEQGQKPLPGFQVACYDRANTLPFLMRNEILIRLEAFTFYR